MSETLFHPEGEGSWPGVIHLTDVGGIRPAQQQMARRLADQGYVVYMPNLFFRTAEPPVMTREPGASREDFMKRMGELTAPLTPSAIESDASRYIDFLASQKEVRTDHPISVVGYCYSGGVAMRFAAARPDRIEACASFHGGGLFTSSPDSPHLLLPRIRARLYFAHAVKDPFMPEEAIASLDQALASWGGSYESEVYEGAYHSWTAPDSPLFNEPQADRAFSKLVAFLKNAH